MADGHGVRARMVLAMCLFGTASHEIQGQPPDSVGRRDSVTRLTPVETTASVIPAAGPDVGSGVPARVTVFQASSIRNRPRRLLTESLVFNAGFSMYDDLGSAFKSTIVTRGFASSPVVGLPQGISVFIDGVPVNEPDAGQVNFDLLPLSAVDSVEVLSGTASMLGPNSLGGAVNFVTRNGIGPARTDIEVSAGSFGRRGADASSAGAIRSWRYVAGGAYEEEGGWRQLTGANKGSVFLRLGNTGERSGVSLMGFGAKSYVETAGSLPSSVYAVRPDSNLSAGDFEDLDQLHVAVSGYARVGPGRGTFSAWARGHRAERFNVNQQDDPDVRGFSRNRTRGVAADWTTRRALERGSFGARAGGGLATSDVGIRIFGERIDPGLTTDVESAIRKADVYLSADVHSGPITIAGGARYDAVRIPFRNRLRPARDTVNIYRRLSPRLGATVDVGGGSTLYASVGRGFRAPAVIELACADPEEPCPLPFALGDDPPLSPVIGTTLEVGARWARNAILATAALYRTSVRDDIFLFPYHDEDEPEGSTIDGYFSNIARTRREGVELAVRTASQRGHSIHATYTFTNATFQTSGVEIFSIRESDAGNIVEAGNRLPLVPDHTFAIGANVRLPAGFFIGSDISAVGRRVLRGDEANDESSLDPFAVTALRLGYEKGGWEIRGVVDNVLDREHALFGTFNVNQGSGSTIERFLTPGQPRSFELSVRRTFSR